MCTIPLIADFRDQPRRSGVPSYKITEAAHRARLVVDVAHVSSFRTRLGFTVYASLLPDELYEFFQLHGCPQVTLDLQPAAGVGCKRTQGALKQSQQVLLAHLQGYVRLHRYPCSHLPAACITRAAPNIRSELGVQEKPHSSLQMQTFTISNTKFFILK